jgi:NADPH-dependent curcumin reductase CurA
MPELKSREVRLAARPTGAPAASDFAFADAAAPEPAEGEIQVRNLWMSVDPYMRGRMADRKSYVAPFAVGAPLEGGAVGEVVASRADGFKPGDLVLSMRGWREAWTGSTRGVRVLEAHKLPPQAFLGVAGVPGLTAYAGLQAIAPPKEGETVFVSAAAGAVGSIACQIAKIKGCRVVGSAGSPEKLAFLEEIGVDATINYRDHQGVGALTRALAAAAPNGVDVGFENVGGDHLAASLNVMNDFGRIAVCGMIAQYNDAGPAPGPTNLALIIAKRLTLRGFIVTDQFALQDAFARDLAGWIAAGRITWRETVREGIESAPDAFLELFKGGNLGKMLVSLA